MLATANKRKTWERFGKNAGEWTGRVEIGKGEILAVGVACMVIYGPAPGLNGRIIELWVLNRRVF